MKEAFDRSTPDTTNGFSISEEELSPEDIFALGELLSIDGRIDQEARKKRDAYVHALLELPEIELSNKEKEEIIGQFRPVFIKTLEFYVAHLPMELQKKLAPKLKQTFSDFDKSEMARKAKKPIVNIKMIVRCIKKKDFLGAYEAFWGTWNPAAHEVTKSAYRALGGNKRPVLSTWGTFLYSGVVLHALNPGALLIYAVEGAVLGVAAVPITAAGVVGGFVVLGIPVMIKKELRMRAKHKETKR